MWLKYREFPQAVLVRSIRIHKHQSLPWRTTCTINYTHISSILSILTSLYGNADVAEGAKTRASLQLESDLRQSGGEAWSQPNIKSQSP